MAATAQITVRMDEEVRAAIDEANARLALMEDLVKTSVRLFECHCEFEGYPGACSEWQEAWDRAVIAYKRRIDADEL